MCNHFFNKLIICREIFKEKDENLIFLWGELRNYFSNLFFDFFKKTPMMLPQYMCCRVGLDFATDHCIKIGTYLLKYEVL